jgi:hypothetical protein
MKVIEKSVEYLLSLSSEENNRASQLFNDTQEKIQDLINFLDERE